MHKHLLIITRPMASWPQGSRRERMLNSHPFQYFCLPLTMALAVYSSA